jgi:membrane protease YdiL (CAAX protease family)
MDKPEFQHPPEQPHGQNSALPESDQSFAESDRGEPRLERIPNPNAGSGDINAPDFRVAPPDFRIPLRARDLLYLVMFYLATGALLTLAVGAATMRLLHISLSMLQESKATLAIVTIVSQALLSGATVMFLFAMVRSRSTSAFWPTLGWRPFDTVAPKAATVMQYVFGGFGLALFVGWVSRYFDQGTALPMEELFRNKASVLLLMGLGILVAPVVEETVFRGCVYPVIARRFGIPTGVIGTGILFGMAHAQQLWGGWPQIGLLICVGTVLTYVRARAGTVVASYLVHLSYNTILFAGFYFATGGLRSFPS